ncbi:MAG: hypothetical protein DRP56_05145 [Planctomycetota bacterium]|nr:MAG: hypothetical protein DRP56_05145 [Planctomycetota bacterium]
MMIFEAEKRLVKHCWLAELTVKETAEVLRISPGREKYIRRVLRRDEQKRRSVKRANRPDKKISNKKGTGNDYEA